MATCQSNLPSHLQAHFCFMSFSLLLTKKLIAGCQDVESSYVLPNDENSLLTMEINRVWDAGQFVGTTPEFFEQVKKGVKDIAYENRIFQEPNLYDVGMKNEKFNTQKPFGIYE